MGRSRQENFLLQTESLQQCLLSGCIQICLLCWDWQSLTNSHEVKLGATHLLLVWKCKRYCKFEATHYKDVTVI